LIEEGWEVASHTVNHAQHDIENKMFCELSLDETRYELEESKKWIEENLGVTPTKFVIPEHLAREDQYELISSIYPYTRPYPIPTTHYIFHALDDMESKKWFKKIIGEIHNRLGGKEK